MPLHQPRRAGILLKTGQTTTYHAGDDGAYQIGLAKRYEALTTGAYSGTTAVDSPGYAAATIAFVAATKKITDTANGLATFKTGDTIRVRGSTSNDGVYTVATGNVAGEIVTTEALVDEAVGAYVTLCKRVSPSNNCILDNNTGLMWRRYSTGGPAEKCGTASDGKLVWYDSTKAYTLHPAAADLQMIASPATLRIVGGAGEAARYFAGMTIVCTGFANAVNNLPGYVVSSVTVNGADLDLALTTFGGTLIAEVAAGARTIAVVCQSIFSYVAAMNAAALAGYSDWRVPNIYDLSSLQKWEQPSSLPDSTYFTSFPQAFIWSSTRRPIAASTSALDLGYGNQGTAATDTIATAQFVIPVRGGG